MISAILKILLYNRNSINTTKRSSVLSSIPIVEYHSVDEAIVLKSNVIMMETTRQNIRWNKIDHYEPYYEVLCIN